jgi:hypothetical protein
VPGSFPTEARHAPAATQTDGPRQPNRTRHLATAAAWTVMDSLQHNFFVPGDSVGLRGGIVDYEPTDDGPQWTLVDARFTEDVTVNGVLRAIGDDFDGAFTMTGPDGTTTTGHFSGAFRVSGADMTITHDTGGATATFTVPGA